MTHLSHFTVIVGLPGSGKSCLVSEMKAANTGLVDADDFHSSSRNDSPMPEESRYVDEIHSALLDGRDVVISDIALCEGSRRLSLTVWFKTLSPCPVVDWIFFENDLDQCLKNVERRPGRNAERDAAAARKFTQVYFPPDNARPVYTAPDATDPVTDAMK